MTRIDLINRFIKLTNASAYLEIGVHSGKCFLNVKCYRKFAVDPKFNIRLRRKFRFLRRDFCNIRNRYFEITSDAFFADHQKILTINPPKVIFIDGLHFFEQVVKDVYNSLNALADDGIIILHDCNPLNASAAMPFITRDGTSPAWNGDTWKTIHYLRRNHPELNVCVLNTDEGLGIVSRKPNIDKHYYDASNKDLSEFADLDYNYLANNRKEILNLYEVTELESVINTYSKRK